MMKYLFKLFTLTLLLACSSKMNQESKDLPVQNEEILSVRNAHAMAYHSGESRTYLFGGANEKEVLSDLWIFENKEWRKVMIRYEPEPRTFSSLVYDEKGDRLILFGGSKVLFGKGPDPENLLQDTWQFKDNTWQKIETNNAPTPRAEAGMVYDKHRNKVLLFGGYTIQGGEYIKLGDTWEFDDNNWQLVAKTGPSARHGAAMAYDVENRYTLLFGGSTIDKQYGPSKGQTWKWNGTEWVRLKIEQPDGVFNAVMSFAGDNEKIIRFGGWNGDSRIDETWSFTNDKWSKLQPAERPEERNHSSMVFDPNRKSAILFGGHDGNNVFGDTWEYKEGNWKKLSGTKPIRRAENGH